MAEADSGGNTGKMGVCEEVREDARKTREEMRKAREGIREVSEEARKAREEIWEALGQLSCSWQPLSANDKEEEAV
ncbi:hypothetical protein E2C01_081340 [Portunus trituberculatus]|uniref:Uncharacterized protein n=1 Tax=Portunus trituberculatus TaxID=210409 RepID=A0A5B7IPH7_PORTR|nr:hypothetical protein [Portunus trituberculatus]